MDTDKNIRRTEQTVANEPKASPNNASAVGAASGVAAGAAAGALGGPIGAAVGAVVGGMVGAVTGVLAGDPNEKNEGPPPEDEPAEAEGEKPARKLRKLAWVDRAGHSSQKCLSPTQ